jgi:hypothetical protein
MDLTVCPSEYSSEESVDAEVDLDPGLRPNEYVVAWINLNKTLAVAVYHQYPGTFPVDSEEALEAALLLVRRFFDEYWFPREDDGSGLGQLKCPRFLPQKHLMFIKEAYGSGIDRRAEMYSVLVEAPGVPLSATTTFRDCDVEAYTAIHPTVSPASGYDVLFTDPPLLPQNSVYQDIYLGQFCLIGSVIDGEEVFLKRFDTNRKVVG